EAPVETVMETVVETVEPLGDEDRRRQAEIPWAEIPRAEIPWAEIPSSPPPRRKGVGISGAHRIGIGGVGRCRDLIDLRRQSRRILGDPPAPIGLLAGLDDRLLL